MTALERWTKAIAEHTRAQLRVCHAATVFVQGTGDVSFDDLRHYVDMARTAEKARDQAFKEYETTYLPKETR